MQQADEQPVSGWLWTLKMNAGGNTASISSGLLAPPSVETHTAKKPDCQDVIELQRCTYAFSLCISHCSTAPYSDRRTPTDWTTKQIKSILKYNIAIDHFSQTVVLNWNHQL